MKPKKTECCREHGVALITTVIVVAVLAVVAVAMMQTTTVDRLSSRSVANSYRARLAADAGLATASAALATNMTNDSFIVVANTNNQLFVGNGSRGSRSFSYIPVFSTVSTISPGPAPITSAGVPSTSVAGGMVFTNQLAGGLSVTSPAISWVNLTNAAGQTTARFAYWVEDLGGKLDLSVVGSADPDIAKRPTGTDPGEIALWSVFNPASSVDYNNAVAAGLIAGRSNLLTAASARLVDAGVTTAHLSDFAVNLRHDTNEPEVIPFGLGYSDEGKAKYDLNSFVVSGNTTNLVAAIITNLPSFGGRGGAMSNLVYLTNIAANIIDYADKDNAPTGDSATYFGMENIPWPNELFDRIRFTSVTSSGLIRIELKDWVEFWNMSHTNSPETTVSIDNNYDLVLTFTNQLISKGFQKNLKEMTLESGSWGPRSFAVPSLAPNEYKVIDSVTTPATRRLAVQIPSAFFSPISAPDWRIVIDKATETKGMTYTASVGGVVVQRSQGGRWPRYSTSAGLEYATASKSMFIFGNHIGYAWQSLPSANSEPPVICGGDPRAQFFLRSSDNVSGMRNFNYTNNTCSPGGRNWEKLFTPLADGGMENPGFAYSEVNPEKFWPDGGHAVTNERGTNFTSHTNSPTNVNVPPPGPQTYNDGWVMFRNDTGIFSNVCELGNIYDPLQWGDTNTSITNTQPGLWMDLSSYATNDPRFGGRSTLRIGRRELSRFANDGLRASQLLDLFAASTNPVAAGGVVQTRVAGKINLNTASTNVLRALAAGVTTSRDNALQPSGRSFVVPVVAVDEFVASASKFRANGPFLSPAQLDTLTMMNNSAAGVFGNKTLLGVTEWNDHAAEEWFAKVYPLAAVRSRNFLVYVVGQAVMTNGTTVLATSRRAYQIYLEPQRGANGVCTNSIPRVLASWEL